VFIADAVGLGVGFQALRARIDMDIQVTRASQRAFNRAEDVFGRLTPGAMGELVAASAGIALVLSRDGTIRDVSYKSQDLALLKADQWIGRSFVEIVTPESAQKIADMLAEVAAKGISRRRQVNHDASGMEDLPVDYVLVTAEGLDGSIALGTELRRQLELQQQLINTQIDLERRNREVTEKAARYRAQFKLSEAPTMVVGGSDLRIADANGAAATYFQTTEKKLEGSNFGALIEASVRAGVLEQMTAARFSGDHVTLACPLASGQHAEISVRPFRETSAVNLIVTVNGQGTAAPAVSDRRLEAQALALLPEACVIVDEDGTVIDVNAHFIELAGLAGKSQVIDRNISDWLGASPVDMNVLVTRLKKLGLVRRFSSILNDSQGSARPVVLSASGYDSGGRQRIAISISENSRTDGHFRLQPSGDISAASDFSELIGRVPLKELIRDAADIIEKMCIEAALRQTGNNRASAADLLGLSRQSLYMKLRRYGLEDFSI
jgi:transcriptional regulator PpsR